VIGASAAGDCTARVCGVLVTYRPDTSQVALALTACRPQLDGMVVVDNGSPAAAVEQLRALAREHACALLELGTNRGAAAAQNLGVTWAARGTFTHCLFLDQDSIAAAKMVDRLLGAYLRLQQVGRPVAAVGPLLVDRHSGRPLPFVRFTLLGVRREACARIGGEPVEADFLISSGMLTEVSRLQEVGPMDEGLFVDNIDLEWCFRARGRGLRVFGVCDAVMSHAIGDSALRLWVGRWFHIRRHGPVRQYYMMRNRLALYRRSYTPRPWIVQDLLRLCVKILAVSVLFAPRLRNTRMMWEGARDALSGRFGPHAESLRSEWPEGGAPLG
jgi:rhamnosyltransferase